MRDIDTIDSELRLLVAIRRMVREAETARRTPIASTSCSTSERPPNAKAGDDQRCVWRLSGGVFIR
ncbi:hypothetical protein A5674_11890 [Mycobacterium malmoense]|uniref:hypothetical protein n=1 Tax=Mycobacterium malmoense TaxID=1780 RepID=UPI00080BDBDA|nr:hypothetical protein [Mycobacterium malmoense]OCB17313.1 hypothetical protein A5674_11890 [Mycobacterium malmoense]